MILGNVKNIIKNHGFSLDAIFSSRHVGMNGSKNLKFQNSLVQTAEIF